MAYFSRNENIFLITDVTKKHYDVEKRVENGKRCFPDDKERFPLTKTDWYLAQYIGEMPTTRQKYESWKPKFRWCPELGAIFPQDIFPACELEESSIPQNSDSSISSIETSLDSSYNSVEPKNRSKIPTSQRVLRSAMRTSNKSRNTEKMTESLTSMNLNEYLWYESKRNSSDLEL